MMPNVTRGDRMAGLVSYLVGGGRHNEHTEPHLVAGDHGPSVAAPGHPLYYLNVMAGPDAERETTTERTAELGAAAPMRSTASVDVAVPAL